MKKITLSLIILGAVIISNAQIENDYNSYRYAERKSMNEKISTEGYQEFLSKECDILQLQKAIKNYNETKMTMYLDDIGNCNCIEANDYIIDIINISSDEKARKLAIEMIGNRKHYDAIPLLLNQVKKDISSEEKIVIGKALTFLDRKTEALEILDCNCYAINYMDDNCIYTYLNSFDYSIAIKYFEYYFDKPETQLEAACWLAIFGIYDKTFPLFVEFLKNNNTYSKGISYSLVGLAAIGTEEALEVIKQQTKNNTSLITRSATLILDQIMNERSEK